MARRTIRHEYAELELMALNTHHVFQKERLQIMLEKEWKAHAIHTDPVQNVRVIAMIRPENSDFFGIIYPNGLYVNKPKGKKKITWSWAEVKKYAEATIRAF